MSKRTVDEVDTTADDETESKRPKEDESGSDGRFDYLDAILKKDKEGLNKVQIQVVGLIQKSLEKPPGTHNQRTHTTTTTKLCSFLFTVAVEKDLWGERELGLSPH